MSGECIFRLLSLEASKEPYLLRSSCWRVVYACYTALCTMDYRPSLEGEDDEPGSGSTKLLMFTYCDCSLLFMSRFELSCWNKSGLL